jgi:hypothetical protein
MTIEAGLIVSIVSRFLHYAFVLSIFGLSLFPFYTKTGGQYLIEDFWRWKRKLLLISAAFGFLSAGHQAAGHRL